MLREIVDNIAHCLLGQQHHTNTSVTRFALRRFARRRFAMVVAVNITWVHTPELYGTEIRGTGHSICSAMSRIGALLSPFVVYEFPVVVVGMLFFMSASLAGYLTNFLPETKGKDMGGAEEVAIMELEGKVIKIRRTNSDITELTNPSVFPTSKQAYTMMS
jgi:hypothetical protein